MEYCLSSLFTINNTGISNRNLSFSGSPKSRRNCRPSVIVSCTSNYGGFSNGNSSYCKFSSLNTPIEPVTPAGRFLSSVLLNKRKSFHDAVAETLESLVGELDDAFLRKSLAADSIEACLHSKIADLKEHECKTAVEDIMYMLICYKFSELKVHLIPRLSKCVYNNRLEIFPSKDYELESIHSFEILEMVKHHLTSVIGWRPDFSVTDSWATTNIKRGNLSQIYTNSILFGYFLKSATLRHRLETCLVDPVDTMIFNNVRRRNLVFGGNHNTISMPQFEGKKKRETLSCYLMGFAADSLAKCAKPNSEEASNLITKHCVALFGNVESEDAICTSFATLKRFVLEAIAFGSFLWDSEEYVKTVYNLEDNK